MCCSSSYVYMRHGVNLGHRSYNHEVSASPFSPGQPQKPVADLSWLCSEARPARFKIGKDCGICCAVPSHFFLRKLILSVSTVHCDQILKKTQARLTGTEGREDCQNCRTSTPSSQCGAMVQRYFPKNSQMLLKRSEKNISFKRG